MVWTDEKIAKLRDLIFEGLTYKELEEVFTLSDEALRRIIKKTGLPSPSRIIKWKKAKLDTIEKLRREGNSLNSIAKILGVTRGAISGIIHYHKLPITHHHHKWSKERPALIERIKEYFRAGRPNREIAGILGLAPKYIPNLARRLGISRTKEEIAKALRNSRYVYRAVMREINFKKLEKHLSPIRGSFEIGYLVGAFRASGKCKCRDRLHYISANIQLIGRVTNILSKLGMPFYLYKDVEPESKGYTFSITVSNRALATYLSVWTKKLKKRFPRILGHIRAGTSYEELLQKIQKNYSRFPFDLPTAKRRKIGGATQKRWWPKWTKSFSHGFVQGIWDALGKVRFGRDDAPSLLVRVREPYIAEFLIWSQRKIGIRGGSIVMRRFKYRKPRRARYAILLLSRKSIETFAERIAFPDYDRDKLLKRALERIKEIKRGFAKYK